MKEFLLDLFQTIGIFNIDASDFQITDEPVKDGEKILGEMNEFEKSCMAFLEMKTKEDDDLGKQMEDLCEIEQMEDLDESSESFKKLTHQHYLLTESMSIISKLMWHSVNTRFTDAEQYPQLGFRNGNKVVAILENDEDENEDEAAVFVSIRNGSGLVLCRVWC